MDDARRKILERRSRFVAAAISTIAIGCEPPAPQPCLKTAPPDAMSAPDEGVAEDASTPEEDATTVPAAVSLTAAVSVAGPAAGHGAAGHGHAGREAAPVSEDRAAEEGRRAQGLPRLRAVTRFHRS